jgi:Tfp pilus assembly protein PilF
MRKIKVVLLSFIVSGLLFQYIPSNVFANGAKDEKKFQQVVSSEVVKILCTTELVEQGKYQEAIDACTGAIQQNPKNATAYGIRGYAYHELGNSEQAIEDYSIVISLEPNMVVAYNNRGVAYRELGNYEQAINDFNKAIEVDPKHGRAYYHRAVAYDKLGNNKQAFKDYKVAFGLGDKYAERYFMSTKEAVVLQKGKPPTRNYYFELGLEVSSIEYKESGLMKDTGTMYGVVGSYTYRNRLMVKGEGRYSWGQVDYSSNGTGDINNVKDYMWEFRGLVGYNFPIFKSLNITPYVGIGHRYLKDDTSGRVSTTGASGYERESHYLYSPIGLESISSFKSGWSITAFAEYDYFWWGEQYSHLGDAIPGLNTVKNTQNTGYGARGSIMIQKKIKEVEFAAGPFIRYWNISESKTEPVTFYGTVVNYGQEPKNTSTEYGLKIAIKF